MYHTLLYGAYYLLTAPGPLPFIQDIIAVSGPLLPYDTISALRGRLGRGSQCANMKNDGLQPALSSLFIVYLHFAFALCTFTLLCNILEAASAFMTTRFYPNNRHTPSCFCIPFFLMHSACHVKKEQRRVTRWIRQDRKARWLLALAPLVFSLVLLLFSISSFSISLPEESGACTLLQNL